MRFIVRESRVDALRGPPRTEPIVFIESEAGERL